MCSSFVTHNMFSIYEEFFRDRNYNGTGETSDIIKVPNPKQRIKEWVEAILKAIADKT